KKTDKVIVRMEDGKPTITNTRVNQTLYLTERAQEYAERSIYYSGTFNTITYVRAFSLFPHPNGKKYLEADVSEVVDKHPMTDGIFYDDNKSKFFIYPGLMAGAISNLVYQETINDVHFMDGFYFSTYKTTVNSEYSINYPADLVSVKYFFIGDSSKIKFTKTKNKEGYTILNFEAKNLLKIPYERDAPNIRNYVPHVIPYIEKYYDGKQWVEVFSDVAHLHKWYYSFIKSLHEEALADASLHRLVDSLIITEKSDFGKMKKIFYWVQNNIKYIAFEDGLGGFIPRKPSAICTNRYGDCKDMANLLDIMLTMAGLKAFPAWIGTRMIPYTYQQVPTPAVDNHMIAVALVDGKTYFLDATGSYLNVNFPSPMIQGKEALVSKGENNFEVLKVPEVGAERNQLYDSTVLTLEGKTLLAKTTASYTGLQRYMFVAKNSSLSKNKRNEVLQEGFKKGNNKTKVSNFSIHGFDDRDSDITITYNSKIPDYAVQSGDEIFVNMALDKRWLQDAIDTAEKKLALEHDIKYTVRNTTILNLPQGYSITKLNQPKSWHNSQFGFDISYEKLADKVVCHQTLTSNFLVLNPKDFQEWNKMIDALQDAYGSAVVLKKNK
ncbi:MAG: DUF3857 domain-containing protein, partial [Bacteroidetes bacterium]|nr:DUF3857 domain-containing protein [Bacteroidota bacterium]